MSWNPVAASYVLADSGPPPSALAQFHVPSCLLASASGTVPCHLGSVPRGISGRMNVPVHDHAFARAGPLHPLGLKGESHASAPPNASRPSFPTYDVPGLPPRPEHLRSPAPADDLSACSAHSGQRNEPSGSSQFMPRPSILVRDVHRPGA